MKKILKSFKEKLLCAFMNRTLQTPSEKEVQLIDQLRAAFMDVPDMPSKNVPPSEAAWRRFMDQLRNLVLTQDPRVFLSWDVVYQTMFIPYAHYTYGELRHLRRRADWNPRMREAIKEVSAGNPFPYIFYPKTSANLVHHAYHVSQFERKTGVNISDIEFVFEFGGGYGSMCRLFHNLGFSGRYVILDLKPFSALQAYYLKSLELPVVSLDVFKSAKSGIACVSDRQKIKKVLDKNGDTSKSMFVATWSISETPRHVRDEILPFISNFDAFLIAYQHRFEEMDNHDFFNRWRSCVNGVNWHHWPITHIPGNSYLVGAKSFPN